MGCMFIRHFAVVILLSLSASALLSQEDASTAETSVYEAEQQRDSRDSTRNDAAGGCGLSMLFGAFCALWAQNTRRSALLWFILGGLFNVITVLVLLYKNSQDLKRGSPPIQGTPPQPGL